jgi:hypothetical protein
MRPQPQRIDDPKFLTETIACHLAKKRMSVEAESYKRRHGCHPGKMEAVFLSIKYAIAARRVDDRTPGRIAAVGVIILEKEMLGR